MKIIYSGLESSGKSYKLAQLAAEIAERNAKWKRETGLTRSIATNLEFSPEFTRYCQEDLQIPVILWENLDDLIKLDNCDVFIDEVGNYFDSRMWADLSLDVRRWLTQGAKSGLELYGSAQDFAQVDKSFRRLVNHLFHITKLVGSRRPSATQPPVNRIWGVCSIRELDAQNYSEEKKAFDKTDLIPSFFLLTREYCELFDTSQKIRRSRPPLLKHIDRQCELPTCVFHKVAHV